MSALSNPHPLQTDLCVKVNAQQLRIICLMGKNVFWCTESVTSQKHVHVSCYQYSKVTCHCLKKEHLRFDRFGRLTLQLLHKVLLERRLKCFKTLTLVTTMCMLSPASPSLQVPFAKSLLVRLFYVVCFIQDKAAQKNFKSTSKCEKYSFFLPPFFHMLNITNFMDQNICMTVLGVVIMPPF